MMALLLMGDGLLLVLHGGPKLAFFLLLHGAVGVKGRPLSMYLAAVKVPRTHYL